MQGYLSKVKLNNPYFAFPNCIIESIRDLWCVRTNRGVGGEVSHCGQEGWEINFARTSFMDGPLQFFFYKSHFTDIVLVKM